MVLTGKTSAMRAVAALLFVLSSWTLCALDYAELWAKTSQYDKEGYLAGFMEGMGIAAELEASKRGSLPQWFIDFTKISGAINPAMLFLMMDDYYSFEANKEKSWGEVYMWALEKWASFRM